MKKFMLRSLKVLGILFLGLFITAFVWANWEKPGPGAKAEIVDFLQFDVSSIKDSSKVASIQKSFKQLDGVHGSTYNRVSQLLVVSYGVSETDRATITQHVNDRYGVHLKEKNFSQAGPKCPINVSYIVRVKRFLCVRD